MHTVSVYTSSASAAVLFMHSTTANAGLRHRCHSVLYIYIRICWNGYDGLYIC